VGLAITTDEYARLSRFLSSACGIELGENKQYLVSSRLRNLLERHGMKTLGELLAALGQDGWALKQQLIEAMTTHETLWFRDQYPYEGLKRMILPELARGHRPDVRIWSAACSSGQEPYSIAMITDEYGREQPRHPLGNVQIVATDVSSPILRSAREGVYEDLALSRGLTAGRRARFFDEAGDKARIKAFLRGQVTFRELNLITPFTALGRFNVIFCRNVLIYFSDERKRDILDRMADALEPGGYLFLGGSESVSRYSSRYEAARCFGGVVFRLKEGT
jgi:chemotaxis protein methyltransferase CheR